MKTMELNGTQLDYWVARAMGGEHKLHRFADDGKPPNDMAWVFPDGCHIRATTAFNPSSNWGQGGPIIDKELIELSHDRGWREDGTFGRVWQAHCTLGYWDGDTALIAAMRCYVAERCGDEVE